MRVGAISDIHANLPALEATLAAMPPVDALICAGDVVGYYPWPSACIELLQDQSVIAIKGNHDRALVNDDVFRFHGSALAGLEYAQRTLDPSHRRWLAELPDDRILFDDRLRLVHGHPSDPDRYTYPADVDASIFVGEPIIVLGHTHVQFVETLAEGIVCNPGSVGQPRDGDPRAGYAVIDLEEHAVETHRVEYDIERTQQAVRREGLPESVASRLLEGR